MIEKREYSPIGKLDDTSANYFVVPASIISNLCIDEKRVSVFSFLSIRRGLDNCLSFSIDNVAKWLGRQPNRHKNGINNKIIEIINYLNDHDYIYLLKEQLNSSYVEAEFNLLKIYQECKNDRFAVIYIDEVKKILDYHDSNSKDTYFNNDIILLVFAYLRMKIYKRQNELMPEEVNTDNKNDLKYDIESRRLRAPEAYDCYYYEIAEELGLSSRTVSKAVNVLNQLELIYSESLPRIKYNDGNTERWRTDHTIFCNTYKRKDSLLLASGKEYYLTEIMNKKKKLKII
jgi:DNA-binding transcriptional ArsR family regulator